MNRKVWAVKVEFNSQVVAGTAKQARELTLKHLFDHPEKLEVDVKWVTDCDVLELWEVQK